MTRLPLTLVRFSRFVTQPRAMPGRIRVPEIIQEFARIYPNAPKLIFEDFHAQSKHRRELEKSVVGHNIALGARAQLIGGALGFVGLIGSFVVIALGHDWAGVAVATGCVLGLVGTFVIGKQGQKQERIEKEEIRRRIRNRDPVAEVDQSRGPEHDLGRPNPSDVSPKS